jgi:hypothetical protein
MSQHPRILVFYVGMLHSEHHVFPRLEELGPEIYNGAYVYVHTQWLPQSIWEPPGWYRPDKTPRRAEDVPKELLLLKLLLT